MRKSVLIWFSLMIFENGICTENSEKQVARVEASGSKNFAQQVSSHSKQTEEFVQQLADKALAAINKPNVGEKEVQAEFCMLLEENFALNNITRFAFGKYFRMLSETQRVEICRCFRNMLSRAYSSQFAQYKSAKFRIIGSREKKTQTLVSSVISVSGKQDVRVIWSVYVTNGTPKIYDAIVDEVSISKIQQTEIMGRIAKVGFNNFLKEFTGKYGN